MNYINKLAKYNIYPCVNSEIALRLIERKKYNKIILISNIGTDFGGKKFIEKARQIIGNNVIALFLAYNIGHLDWVKDFNNALFSNESKFYEEYLECFYGKNERESKDALIKLKNKMESHYNVNFKFNQNFLYYPNFREKGKFEDLTFNL